MTKYIGAIDQGTTSTRFILFDRAGNVVTLHQKEHGQIYPKPGWVEHDALEIWERTQEVIEGALAKGGLSAVDIAAVGVTNQRETTVVWDKNSGLPVYNAIVWQDTRTDAIIAKYSRKGGQDRFRKKTGLPLATYFSGPKIRWILDNVKDAKEKAKRGDLLFGNMDTWIIWKLTGEHVTDVTNASRTMLMNLKSLDWDHEILKAMSIPRGILPQIRSSSEIYGDVKSGILKGISVAGDLGDQQAAMFGQTCFKAGEAKNTYGTGCFMLMNTGKKPVQSKAGLLT
ncbi:MAG: glycerol kinase, partial [Chloroflexi bacterium]